MGYTDGVIKAPVSIFDVQRALGTTDNDLGILCQKVTINSMAKYKPIRNSKIVMLSPGQSGAPSDRYSARFGFAAITPSIQFDGINLDPHSKWQYLKPRGGAQNEPFRLTDFVNEANPTGPGYDRLAAPPFAFGVEGLELTYNTTQDGSGGVGISLYVNSGVNSYPSGMRWNPETCITMSELLNFYSGGAYIGFAIRDITEPSGGFVAVVTRHKLNSVSSSVPTVILHSSNYPAQGGSLFAPEVALLHDGARAGHTFRFIAFLYNTFPSFVYEGTTYTDINAEYSVLSTTPNFSANSLEIDDNVDRHDIVATLVQGGITGLTGFIQGPGVTLTLTSNTPVTINGREYYRYKIGGTAYGSFTTPSGHWNPDGDIRIYLKIASDGRPSYINPETGNFEYSVNVPMPAGNTQYNNIALINFSTLSEPAYIYVEPIVARNEDPYIKITAYAKPSYVMETVYIDGVINASSPRITT